MRLFYSVAVVAWATSCLATPPPGYVKKPDNDKDPPAYEYRYEIGDVDGKGHGKSETRGGEFASGSYFVNTDQASTDVKYFVDDWGYHPVVKYGSADKHSSTTASLALGEHAVKALRDGGEVGRKVELPSERPERKKVQIIQPYSIEVGDPSGVNPGDENLPQDPGEESRVSSTASIGSLGHSTPPDETAYAASSTPASLTPRPLPYAPLQEVRDVYANNDYQNAALIDEQLFLQSAAGNFGQKVHASSSSSGGSGVTIESRSTTSRPASASPAYSLTKQNGDVTYTVHSGSDANTAYLSAAGKPNKKNQRFRNRYQNRQKIATSSTTEVPSYSGGDQSLVFISSTPTAPLAVTPEFTSNDLNLETRVKYDYPRPEQTFTEFGPADPGLVNFAVATNSDGVLGHEENHETVEFVHEKIENEVQRGDQPPPPDDATSFVSAVFFRKPIVVAEVTPGYDLSYNTPCKCNDHPVLQTTPTPTLSTTIQPVISTTAIPVTPKYSTQSHITTSAAILNPIQAGVTLVHAGETHLITDQVSQTSQNAVKISESTQVKAESTYKQATFGSEKSQNRNKLNLEERIQQLQKEHQEHQLREENRIHQERQSQVQQLQEKIRLQQIQQIQQELQLEQNHLQIQQVELEQQQQLEDLQKHELQQEAQRALENQQQQSQYEIQQVQLEQQQQLEDLQKLELQQEVQKALENQQQQSQYEIQQIQLGDQVQIEGGQNHEPQLEVQRELHKEQQQTQYHTQQEQLGLNFQNEQTRQHNLEQVQQQVHQFQLDQQRQFEEAQKNQLQQNQFEIQKIQLDEQVRIEGGQNHESQLEVQRELHKEQQQTQYHTQQEQLGLNFQNEQTRQHNLEQVQQQVHQFQLDQQRQFEEAQKNQLQQNQFEIQKIQLDEQIRIEGSQNHESQLEVQREHHKEQQQTQYHTQQEQLGLNFHNKQTKQHNLEQVQHQVQQFQLDQQRQFEEAQKNKLQQNQYEIQKIQLDEQVQIQGGQNHASQLESERELHKKEHQTQYHTQQVQVEQNFQNEEPQKHNLQQVQYHGQQLQVDQQRRFEDARKYQLQLEAERKLKTHQQESSYIYQHLEGGVRQQQEVELQQVEASQQGEQLPGQQLITDILQIQEPVIDKQLHQVHQQQGKVNVQQVQQSQQFEAQKQSRVIENQQVQQLQQLHQQQELQQQLEAYQQPLSSFVATQEPGQDPEIEIQKSIEIYHNEPVQEIHYPTQVPHQVESSSIDQQPRVQQQYVELQSIENTQQAYRGQSQSEDQVSFENNHASEQGYQIGTKDHFPVGIDNQAQQLLIAENQAKLNQAFELTSNTLSQQTATNHGALLHGFTTHHESGSQQGYLLPENAVRTQELDQSVTTFGKVGSAAYQQDQSNSHAHSHLYQSNREQQQVASVIPYTLEPSRELIIPGLRTTTTEVVENPAFEKHALLSAQGAVQSSDNYAAHSYAVNSVERIVEKHIPVPQPYPVETIVEKKVLFPVEVEKVVEKTVPYPVDRIVEKHIPILHPYPVHIKVPQPYPVEKIIPKPYPVETIVEKPIRVHVPVTTIVEKKVPVPQPYPVEVEKVVEKKVPYPVEKVVERIVEKPVHIRVPYAVEVPRNVPYGVRYGVSYQQIMTPHSHSLYVSHGKPRTPFYGLPAITRQHEFRHKENALHADYGQQLVQGYSYAKPAVSFVEGGNGQDMLASGSQQQTHQYKHLQLSQSFSRKHNSKGIPTHYSSRRHAVRPGSKDKSRAAEYIGPVPPQRSQILTRHHQHSLQGQHPAQPRSPQASTAATRSPTSTTTLRRSRDQENKRNENTGNFRQSRVEYGFKPPMIPSVQYDEKTASKVES